MSVVFFSLAYLILYKSNSIFAKSKNKKYQKEILFGIRVRIKQIIRLS